MIRKLAAVAVFLYLLAVTCPIRSFALLDDLDASWVFAVNFAAAKGLRYGADIVWTSGPLGWIACPMTVGSNLEWATAAQVTLWMGMMVVLFLLWRGGHTGTGNLALFGVFLTPPVFEAGGYFGLDTYIVVLMTLLLVYATLSGRWQAPFAAATVLTAALILMKATAGAMATGVLAGFLVALSFDGWRPALLASIGGGIGVAGAVAGYFALFQSPRDLVDYLRGSSELSSGFSVAMGIGGPYNEVIWAMAAPVPAAALFAALYHWSPRAARCAWMFPAPLFLTFKHGFVRHDGHVVIYFSFTLILTATALLVTNFDKLPKWIPAAAALGCAFIWTSALWHRGYWRSADPVAKVMKADMAVRQALHLGLTRRSLERQSNAAAASRPLSAEMRRAIGPAAVGSLAPIFSYAYSETVNWKPLPILQTYAAYTPWLDRRIAASFERGEYPFLTAEWQPIDGRNPLADTPATWLSVYKWYEVAERSPERLLLRKRAFPRFDGQRQLEKSRRRIGDPTPLPRATRPLIVSIKMDLSLYGLLRKALFRIPDVWLALATPSGSVQTFRAMPDVLRDGLLVNVLPASLDEMENALGANWSSMDVDAVYLSGPGRRYYRPEIDVEIAEVPGLQLPSREAAIPFDPSLLTRTEGAAPLNVDHINLRPAGGEAVVDSESESFLIVRGWAVDAAAQDTLGGLLLTIDGRNYPARYGLDRPDVAAHFFRPAYRFCGYEGIVPVAQIGKGRHELTLRHVRKDLKTYFPGERSLVFYVR